MPNWQKAVTNGFGRRAKLVPSEPRRRWTRWSLRGLLLVIVVFGIWLGYEMNWIRERRILAARQAAMIATLRQPLRDVEVYREAPQNQPLPASILNFLGEPSRQMVMVVLWDQSASGKVDASAESELQYAAELFPESIISWVRAN